MGLRAFLLTTRFSSLYLKAYCPRVVKGHDMSVIQPPQLLRIAVFFFALCVNFPVPCSAEQQPIPQAMSIQFEGDLPFTPNPLVLKGYLRRPQGAGRYPAIVLLHGCAGFAERLDQHWGERLASW